MTSSAVVGFRVGSMLGSLNNHLAIIAASGGIKELFGNVYGLIMVLAFLGAVVLIIMAGMKFKDGENSSGFQILIGAIVVGGAGAIAGFMFKAGGMEDAKLDAEFGNM